MVSGPNNADSILKAAAGGAIRGGNPKIAQYNPGGIFLDAKDSGHVTMGGVEYEGTIAYPQEHIASGETSGRPDIDYGRVGKETLEGAAEGMQSDKKWSGTVHIEGETEYSSTNYDNGKPVGEVTGKVPYTTDVKVEGEWQK